MKRKASGEGAGTNGAAPPQILHDPSAKVFGLLPCADSMDGNKMRGRSNSVAHCMLEYDLLITDSRVTMAITETFVPPRLRGKGLASLLCDAAFDYAESKDWTIDPICTYVRDNYVPKRLARVPKARQTEMKEREEDVERALHVARERTEGDSV